MAQDRKYKTKNSNYVPGTAEETGRKSYREKFGPEKNVIWEGNKPHFPADHPRLPGNLKGAFLGYGNPISDKNEVPAIEESLYKEDDLG